MAEAIRKMPLLPVGVSSGAAGEASEIAPIRTHRIKPGCGTLSRYILDVVLFVRDHAFSFSPNMIAVEQRPPKRLGL
jgi:hypothetical protein